MAEATFAQLPVDLVLGGSSNLDGVGERCGVGVVVVVGGGGGVVGAEPAAVGHPVPLVVGAAEVFARLPAGDVVGVRTAGCGGMAAAPCYRGGASIYLSIYLSIYIPI
jgi:hypothetical protein